MTLIGLIFFCLFNVKVIFVEEQLWDFLTNSKRYKKKVHTFPYGISQKGNVIVWLEFELAYYDVKIQLINQYTVRALLLTLSTLYIYCKIKRQYFII